ncbi:hypothetical protein FTO70_10815 [Methanosarcina sp. KYL-1]|uniref:hypothetical protein n=1 Tax=Methanosarcina sp. KYL-1 TaxID=2602068 RepID=UPI002100EA61|nr:hypothetical protein [Methanosarcina sp. KYL-1]MCQ1536162.1 hypothetical protein [Methanosarcina sp. KYL-1]
MARILSDKDIDLLKKLAPECEDLLCSGSGVPYRSILPPLANHYSEDAIDFHRRLSGTSPEDLEYLISLIFSGEESLGCVPPDYITIFLRVVAEKLGEEAAAAVRQKYEENRECHT